MITGPLKTRIDKLWEEFWTGGITNPLTVIEQISFLAFARLLDIRESTEEKKHKRLHPGKRFRGLFSADEQELRWQNFKNFGGEAMLPLVRDKVFPHFRKLGEYMKDAQLMIQKPSLMVSAVNMIDALPLTAGDTKGDLYEYLLSKLTTAGINGQFRTPRHIIRLMVDLLEPKPTDVIGDPACGTGGFLVGVIENLRERFTSEEGKIMEGGPEDGLPSPSKPEDGLPSPSRKNESTATPSLPSPSCKSSPEDGLPRPSPNQPSLPRPSRTSSSRDGLGSPSSSSLDGRGGPSSVTYTGDLLEPYREHIQTRMFHGFDFDVTMLRIAAMNLMLHGVDQPNIHWQDTLSNSFPEHFPKFAANAFDLILANPPFKGSLDANDVHTSLTGKVKTKKTELLFLVLMLRMLKLGGRCAVIVPDGVLFGSSKAHVELRKLLVEANQLEAVVKLPAGVFKPYAGVSTAILIFTKGGRTEHVWYYNVQADGFSLDDKRDPVAENDLPDIREKWFAREKAKKNDRKAKNFLVPVKEIRDNNYDLSISRYRETEYEDATFEAPEEIIKRPRSLDLEVGRDMDELEVLLK